MLTSEVDQLRCSETTDLFGVVSVHAVELRFGDLFHECFFTTELRCKSAVGVVETKQLGVAHRVDAVFKRSLIFVFGLGEKSDDLLRQIFFGSEIFLRALQGAKLCHKALHLIVRAALY